MSRRVRRALTALLVAVCLAVVLGYQLTRPREVAAESRVFVPSPKSYEKLPDSLRTTLADAYWLYLIQYYGENVREEGSFESLPEILDLVTALDPEWSKPYVFGAYALLDYGRPDLAYALMKRGYGENPDDWRLPFNLGVFAYWFGGDIFAPEVDEDQVAARWFEQAADLPGSRPNIRRLAAALYQKGDDKAKAVNIWFQVYGEGDEVSREKAVDALKVILPTEQERRDALVALRDTIPEDRLEALSGDLLGGP